MKPAERCILTVNGGSSSIKVALFEDGDSLEQILEGGIDRIGFPNALFHVKAANLKDSFSQLVTAPNHTIAVGALMDWIEKRSDRGAFIAVGHRVLQGGPNYYKPQRITADMIAELHRLSLFDPEHIPEEVELIEASRRRFPDPASDRLFRHRLPS